jgi:hypothetical protein
MIKSTSEAVGTGVNRTVSEKTRRTKPITALFPGGSVSSFGKPMGEMKVVKKTFWGLFGSYTRYVKEFVPYEEDDFIDNKVLNGGGGSGVSVATPPPEPPAYVVPPLQGLKVDEISTNSITLSWDPYPDDPENPTYKFLTFINGVQNKYIDPTTSFAFPALIPGIDYALGIQVRVIHEGIETMSIIQTVNAKTLINQ